MKLPSGVRTGVQQLQGGSVSDVVQTGRAWAGAAENASSLLYGAHADYQAKKSDSQIRQADLSLSSAMTDFESKYAGKEFIPSDEIPDNIQVRRTEKSVGLDGIEVENPRNDIPAYEVYADMYRDFGTKTSNAISSSIDSEAHRGKWLTNATIVGNTQYTARAVASNKQQDDHLNAQLDLQIESATKNRNYGVAKHLAGDIKNDVKRQEITNAIGAQEEVDTINDAIMAKAETDEDLNDAEALISDLRSDEYSGQLSVSERSAYANSLEAATAEHEASIISMKKKENAQIVNDTWRGIDSLSPHSNEDTIQTLFDDNLISGPEMTNMLRTLERNRAEAISKQVDKQFVLSGNPIDPKDKDSRDAVNALYQEEIGKGGDPKTVAIDFMRQFKVVPDSVISVFRANNRANAPKMAEASDMLIYAQDYAPQSLLDFKPNEIDVVEKVAANRRLGMSTPDAIAAVESYDMLSPDQKATLNRNSKVIATDNTAALADQVSSHAAYDIPWNPFNPDVPMFMDSEYTASVTRHLPDVGWDMKVAQNLAFADVAKRWQLTDVNDRNEIMKFAPMGKTEVVRRAITSQYKEVMPEIKKLTEGRANSSGVRIASDSLTAIQVSRGLKPTYQAYVVLDEDTGEVVALPRFTWDSDAANKAEKVRLAKEGQIERERRTAAKAESDANRHTTSIYGN